MSTIAKQSLPFTEEDETPKAPAIRQFMTGDDNQARAVFCERFTVLKSLGATEGSTLYLAQDRRAESSELIRLEVLSDDAAGDRKQLELFYLEASAAARLSHESIIKSWEAERVGQVHCRASEHCPKARTLRDLIDCSGWLDTATAIKVITSIAGALGEAHQKGVLHLRVHPEDILIEPGGRASLSGFGIDARKELAWAHRERSNRHSLHYISPEQARGESVDPRSDLYSLGVVLFEALTDRVPFDSGDLDLVARKHINQVPPRPDMLRAEIPESLSDVVMRLLAKRPESRFQSAALLESVLASSSPRISVPVIRPAEPVAPKEYDRREPEAPLPAIEPDEDEATRIIHPVESRAEVISAQSDPIIKKTLPAASPDAPGLASSKANDVELEYPVEETGNREPYEAPNIIRLNSPPGLAEERVAAAIRPPANQPHKSGFEGRYALFIITVILVGASLITLAMSGVSKRTQTPAPAASPAIETGVAPQPPESVPEPAAKPPAAGASSTSKINPQSKSVKSKRPAIRSRKKSVKRPTARRTVRRRR